MALGRTRYREEKMEEAAQHLAAAQAAARAVGDHETWAIATMMLGVALVGAGRLDEAEPQLAEVIASCQRAGDTLHLCSAYNNRIILWIKRESLERAIADQRRAAALAREIAHVQLERMSTYNLAELLYWRGDLVYALSLARRARELQTRFLDDVPIDALLVARISCGLALWGADAEVSTAIEGGPSPAVNSAVRDQPGPAGAHQARAAHLETARRELQWVLAHIPPERRPPIVQTHLRLIELLTADAGGEDRSAIWRTLVEEARRTALHWELQEVLLAAAAAALHEGRLADARQFLEEGAALAGPASQWRDRFADLPGAVAGTRSPGSPLPARGSSSDQSAIHNQQGDIDDPVPLDPVDCRPPDGALV